jgi:hypothetical protein
VAVDASSLATVHKSDAFQIRCLHVEIMFG